METKLPFPRPGSEVISPALPPSLPDEEDDEEEKKTFSSEADKSKEKLSRPKVYEGDRSVAGFSLYTTGMDCTAINGRQINNGSLISCLLPPLSKSPEEQRKVR